jgi:hypothetical protein
MWLHCLFIELHLFDILPVPLLCDNQSALKLAIEDNYHSRMKHINTWYYYIWDVIAEGLIEATYCSTEDMTADTLTKPLSTWKLEVHF